ncbi:condensin complex protein MksE [Winogradskyella forsetii]|uniref:condensin complex protein MksE n=1 Tax=Winogradskyella forsetii TaxID=2686077 RepID=UPI0015BA2FDD|nr:hypothetical protein [Winogradskyella forsetii]
MNTRYTSQIYDILRKGHFICSNSPDLNVQKLYNVLEDEEIFEELYEYFNQINYILEQGNGFFYFSRTENNADLDRKLEKAFSWIDLMDFLKTYDSSFDVGFRFTPSDIANQLKNNADLKSKLEHIKKLGGINTSYPERIKKIIDRLQKENFIILENEITETYKVLTSLNYLKDIINAINISEDIENEIPQ